MSWFDKITMNYPKVQPTSEWKYIVSKRSQAEKVIVSPSVWDRCVAAVISLFLSIVWLALLGMLWHKISPVPVILFAFLFITFIIWRLMSTAFFNKARIFRMVISEQGISMNGRSLQWSAIVNTFIMSRLEGKRTNHYLLILTTDGNVEKINMYNLIISHRKLAGLIEYYKRKAITNALRD